MVVLQKTRLDLLSLKNHILMAPVKTAMCLPDGVVTPQILRYYERMARGGLAAIILEPTAVSADGREHPKQLCIHEDKYVEQLLMISEVIHENDSLVGVHINHAGRAANPKVIGQSPLAPSPMQCPTSGAEAVEMSGNDIERIIDDFGQAARRAVAAHADFIEVQCGHGYLVAQFFSERTNKRDDKWGGSEENRLRCARRVLDTVKVNAGDLPVIARISGSEFVPHGLTPENMQPLLKTIATAGVAAIHVGAGNVCDSPPWYYSHMAMPEEKHMQMLKAIRNRTSLPLIAAGRMGYIPKMQEVMDMGYEFVALGRALIADPEFVLKLADDKADDIVLCGACLDGCLRAVKSGQPIHCIVNPDLTRPAQPAPATFKHIMVVGAGPAGISASLALAGNGHAVDLYEKSDRIGGQFNYASVAPMKKQMGRMLEGLEHQLKHSKVKLHLSTEVTAVLVKEQDPDQAIIATGAVQNVPPMENLDSQHWLTSLEYYAGARSTKGDRILIVGAGLIGLETAAVLADEGKEILCVDPLPEVAQDMEPILRKILFNKLTDMPDVTVRTRTFVRRFDESGVLLVSGNTEECMPPFDTVIIAAGTKPENTLARELRDWNGNLVVIGDAHRAANIEHAFTSGIDISSAS